MITTTRTAARSVITELNSEWDALVSQGAFADQLGAWFADYPSLRDAIGPKDLAAQDRAFHSLLLAHRNGSYAAGRLVLQCMIPAICKMVGRGSSRCSSALEAATDATSAMWTSIATIDLERADRIASRLWSRALDAFTRPNGRGMVDELVVSEAVLDHAAAVVDTSHLDSHPLGPTGEVLEVLAWGLDMGLLKPDEAALLTRLYAPDPDLPEYETLHDSTARDRRGHRLSHSRYQSRVADELGLTHDVVRQRASRAVRRLAEGVQAAL